jgi:transposase
MSAKNRAARIISYFHKMGFYTDLVHVERLAKAQERAMTRKEVLRKAMQGQITWIQAAEILRLSPRQIRRIKNRYEKSGEAGLIDMRLGKRSPRRISDEYRKKICDLYREKYSDFSARHFYEKLIQVHRIEMCTYETVLRFLREAGLVEKGVRRSSHRKRRERRPMTGMMLHLDGSTHAWLGEDHPNFDLLVVLDDATSEVYAAEFVAQEGSKTCMQVLRETIEKKGTFCSLYVDRAMHFVITTQAGSKPDRSRKSQIERALDRLGIELIAAYSPQARGRSERLWRTWQGRLPQELRLAQIKDMTSANRFLKEVFIPWHNQTLVKPASDLSATAFIPIHSNMNLDLIFSIQVKRQVNADNTVQFKKKILQIPKQKDGRFSYAGVSVIVHEHLDQTLSITYGPHLLGRYTEDGLPIPTTFEVAA